MIQEEKPAIHPIEKSPLLQKAQFFAEMLKKDNERIQAAIKEGRQDEISIENLDGSDQVIEMDLIMGVLESKTPQVLPLDTTEMPEDTWRPATAEKQ